MQIPKNIIIKDTDNKITAYLSPAADGIKECYPDIRLNGNSTLEFLLPATSEKLTELTPECQIWAGGRVYSLLKEDAIDFERTEDNKLWAKVMAKERWNDLDYEFPEPYICNDPTISNPADLTVIIVGGGTDLSGGRYEVGTSGHALYAVLDGSEWSIGTVDVPGIYDLEMEKANRLELIRQIQEIWGGYLVWDSVNKTVSLRAGNVWQPYNSFQIRYRKNLKHITRTQSNKIYTKIYPFGHDDLDIASVNDGKKYITNYSYTYRNYIGIYKNQDIYDAQELMDKATAELELNCKPRYNYKVKIADLRTLPEYSHEDFTLGDLADVIDSSAGDARIRILRHKYNLFQPWDCEIELGDPEERFIEDLKAAFDTSHFVGGIFNSRGYSSGQSIEDLTITNAKIKNLDAAKITTGYLSADRIEAGSIGADKIITSELVVGDNIKMGADARISWGQVTEQPDIPVLPDYIQSTYIDETRIESPNIYGGYIYGGTIRGGMIIADTEIDVSEDVYIGDHLYMNSTRFGGGILWGNVAEIYIDPAAKALHISADVIRFHGDIRGINAIEAYYSSNKFYLDYGGSSTLTVRDLDGNIVGWINLVQS
ncbi:MAG TPA: phage tail protein [Clostridia bacterium]|nr:phage tail protein [Clostridia bacterium]